MNYEFIQYRVSDRIAHVTLDRPGYRNAQSRQLLEELDLAFDDAANDSEAKVIILSANGDHFSAGHDLGTEDEKADLERRPMAEGLRGRYKRSRDLYVDFTLRWRDLPKPTIAVVQGYCIFGGWMIASAMDLIFAASDAMFLGTNFQYFSIPWDIHPRKAKEILFESRFVDGLKSCRNRPPCSPPFSRGDGALVISPTTQPNRPPQEVDEHLRSTRRLTAASMANLSRSPQPP